MPDIGIRELKIHASEMIKQIKEKRAHYIITHRGRPVAAIIPIAEAPDNPATANTWAELVQLGQQISRGWQRGQSSAEILSDMRR